MLPEFKVEWPRRLFSAKDAIRHLHRAIPRKKWDLSQRRRALQLAVADSNSYRNGTTGLYEWLPDTPGWIFAFCLGSCPWAQCYFPLTHQCSEATGVVEYSCTEHKHDECCTPLIPTLPDPTALTCSCCGAPTRGRQWWNRKPGFGLCVDCIAPSDKNYVLSEYQRVAYGVRGFHYDLSLPLFPDFE